MCTCGEVVYTPIPIHYAMNTSSVHIQRVYDSGRYQAGLTPTFLDALPLTLPYNIFV